MMADPLLDQSAVDRPFSTANQACRGRLRPTTTKFRSRTKTHANTPACQLTNGTEITRPTGQTRQSLGRGKPLVSSRWQAAPRRPRVVLRPGEGAGAELTKSAVWLTTRLNDINELI